MKKAAWALKLGNQPAHAMIINYIKVIEIFCSLDDFVKACEKTVDGKLIGKLSPQSVHTPGLCDSEIACVELLYHLSGYKCFQYYYQQAVEQGPLKDYFPKAPSYNRFVQLKPRVLPLMILYLNLCRVGWLCGLYYADATSIAICHNRRIGSNRVFFGKARRGKTSMGWFYGFKLFLVVNVYGEIIKVMFATGNVADNNTEHMLKLFNKLKGVVFADRGFINQAAFEQLLSKGLQVVTGIKSNMKNKLMNFNHKLLLRKRGMIESINDILKTVCDIEHTRHRSPINALLNVFAALCAYTWLERLPNIFN